MGRGIWSDPYRADSLRKGLLYMFGPYRAFLGLERFELNLSAMVSWFVSRREYRSVIVCTIHSNMPKSPEVEPRRGSI